jgi:2TM domain
MTNENQQANEKDSVLWELAKKRTGFKKSLMVYIVVNSFLWILWFFTNDNNMDKGPFPWPVWPMFGWGIGLAFQYIGAYVTPNTISVENEYQKLKNK